MDVKMVNRISEVVKEITDLETIDEVEKIVAEAREKITRECLPGFWAGKTPCWEMCHCPDIVKNECPAYKHPELPCWQIEGTYCKLDDYAANGQNASICKLCQVYKQYDANKPLQIKLFGKRALIPRYQKSKS